MSVCQTCAGKGRLPEAGTGLLINMVRCGTCNGRGRVPQGDPVSDLPNGRYWSTGTANASVWWLYRGEDCCYHAFPQASLATGPKRASVSSLCGFYETNTAETKNPGAPACRACWERAEGSPPEIVRK